MAAKGRTAPVATKHRSDKPEPAPPTGKRDREIPEGPKPVPQQKQTPPDSHRHQMARQPEKRTDYKTLYRLVEDVRDRFAQHNQMLWDHLTGVLHNVTPPA